MWTDPIVEEVRKNREDFAAQFNFNLRAMGRALQELEKASGRHVVSFAPKVCHSLSRQEEGERLSTITE